MDSILTPEQASIYFNIMQIWVANPTMRFSELVHNLQIEFDKKNNHVVFNSDINRIEPQFIQDEDFANFLKDFIDEYC